MLASRVFMIIPKTCKFQIEWSRNEASEMDEKGTAKLGLNQVEIEEKRRIEAEKSLHDQSLVL